MQIFSYLDFEPELAESVFVADGAKIIGRVCAKENVNIWFNCVVRADVNKITIGKNTNIQDLSMLHVTEENELWVGKNVTIGHSVILHACRVEDHCLIGMGAKVLDGAVIGAGSLVAAGSIVPPNKVYPPNSFIMGAPAKKLRDLTSDECAQFHEHYQSYVGYAKDFLDPKKHRKLF